MPMPSWEANEAIRDELPSLSPPPSESMRTRLTNLEARVERIEREHHTLDTDMAEGRRLLGSLLVLIGRRLRDEELT